MLYDIYCFVENCMFPQPEQPVGQYIISPAPPIEEETFEAYISRYIAQNPILPTLPIRFPDSVRDDYRKSHPVTLVRRLNIEAKNEQEVIDLTMDDISILCCLLSLERLTAARYMGNLVVNNTLGTIRITLYHDRYPGNLIAPFDSISSILSDLLMACQQEPSFIIHISLYKEAKAERVWDLKYFRYWGLLEAMAFSDYGSGHITKVRDMFKDIFSLFNVSLVMDNINILDEISIWKRHRNCVAHYGVCQKDNKSVCLEHPSYVACKTRVEEAIREKNDKSLFCLEWCANEIIRMRIKKYLMSREEGS